MFNWVRGIVSLNKKRLQTDDFDLDMAYIGERIIAMGFPASGLESLYRNDFSDVRNYLDSHHGSKYWVYNLCSERSYDSSNFYARVSCFPFDDHSPPEFDLIRQFCIEASEWLNKDPENIVVVHCKAGKGRTGVMISSLLLHMKQYTRASDALKYYGQQRAHDDQGVTIPSQKRYVFYYQQYLALGFSPSVPFQNTPCRVTRVLLRHLPMKYFTRSLVINIDNMKCSEEMHIETQGVNGEPKKDTSDTSLDFDLTGIMPYYSGDFQLSITKQGKPICFLCLNSSFVLSVEEFTKDDIDKFSKNGKVENTFRMILFCEKNE